MITKQIALSLSPSTTLYHRTLRNADKSPLRARVNGRVTIWKTRPEHFRIPMKHGLRDCFYIGVGATSTGHPSQWVTSEEAALQGDLAERRKMQIQGYGYYGLDRRVALQGASGNIAQEG